MKKPLIALVAALALGGSLLSASPASAATVTVTGHVTAGGSPVSVAVEWFSRATGDHEGTVSSDSDGSYSLDVPSTAGAYYIVANLDLDSLDRDDPRYAGVFYGAGDTHDYAWQSLAPFTTPTAEVLEIPLDKLGSISGSVPAFAKSDAYLLTSEGTYLDERTVSSTGTYSFSRLVPGRYRIAFDPIGESLGYYSEPITVDVGTAVTPTVAAENGATIKGIVRHGSSRAKNLAVGIFDPYGYLVDYDITDSMGRYSVAGLYEGDYTVSTYPFVSESSGIFGSSTALRSALAHSVQKAAQHGGTKAARAALEAAVTSGHLGSSKLDAVVKSATVVNGGGLGFAPVAHATRGVHVATTRSIDLSVTTGGAISGSLSGVKHSASYFSIVAVSSHYTATARSASGSRYGYRFDSLPAGTYTVYAVDPEGKHYGTSRIAVRSGAVAKPTALKVSRATLTLHVAVPGAKTSGIVGLINESTHTVGLNVLDDSGRTTITGIVPGRQAAVVIAFDHDSSIEEFGLTASGSRTLHAGALFGTITGKYTFGGLAFANQSAYLDSETGSGSLDTDSRGVITGSASAGTYVPYFDLWDPVFQTNAPFDIDAPAITVASAHRTSIGTVALTVGR